MTLLGALRNLQKQRKKQAAAAQRAQTRRENEMIAKRKKYLPMIRRIAKRYHAKVEVLDTAAYISRGKKGVHVNYGESSAVIIRKCEVAFIERAGMVKIVDQPTPKDQA